MRRPADWKPRERPTSEEAPEQVVREAAPEAGPAGAGAVRRAASVAVLVVVPEAEAAGVVGLAEVGLAAACRQARP